MLGLLVLIIAHLSGAVHGASFAGPDMSAVAALSQHDVDDDGSHSPRPEHDHKSGGHIGHAVDRPRTAVQDVAAETDHAGGLPVLSPAANATDARAAWRHLVCPFAAPDSDSTLALHCVWRQ